LPDAMQEQARRLQFVTAHLDIMPAEVADACAQRLRHRFLGGEARRK